MSATRKTADLAPQRFAETFEAIASNVERVIEGKPRTIRLALTALAAEGHVLIEDVPGVGKTMLAKAIARSTSCEWRRIQFTPDLLPSDVTGVSIYDTRSKQFHFNPGAIFANIVLGDEINRASPKTQSALLEAMEEDQVTVDGVTHRLGPPFMVIATQNPIEHAGTFPLPESQLDRFMFRLSIGYPDTLNAVRILDVHGVEEPVIKIEAVASIEDVLWMIDHAKAVFVSDPIKQYIVAIVERTRSHPMVQLGASPRSSLFLLRAARAAAASQAREFVAPDDVRSIAAEILGHRVLIGPEAAMSGVSSDDVVAEVLSSVPAPVRSA